MFLASLLLSFFLTQEQPNIVVLLVDDAGKSDINITNTPNLNALGGFGLKLNSHYVMPVCEPTRDSLFFGIYGNGAGSVCQVSAETPDINQFCLPDVFAGYTKFFTGKWHIGTNNVGQPLGLTPNLYGFDSAKGWHPENIITTCGAPPGNYYNWPRFDNGVSSQETKYNTTVIRNQFVFWWNNTAGPKFAYVCFQAPHAPHQNPPGYSNTQVSIRTKYERTLKFLDATILDMFVSANISLNNTYVIFMTDNGTPPDALAPGQDPLRVKGSSFQGGINVPCVIMGPGIPRGIETNSLTSAVDVISTCAELVGSLPPGGLDGKSWVPLFTDQSAVVHDHVFSGWIHGKAVIQSQYKLHLIDGVEFFYDLMVDPMELVPIDPSTIDPVIVQSLRDQMNIYIARGF